MATNKAHTEVPGGGKPVFPPFQSETFVSQLLWLAITFVALYALMAKVALPRVGAIFEARGKRIADDLAGANRLKGQSDGLVASYERVLADARARAQTTANETRNQAETKAAETRKRLAAQLDARLAESEKTIGSAKDAAMANVQTIAVDSTGAIVERLTGLSPSPQDVVAAVSAVLERQGGR
jgi:F-type H+-transporting ATPase subunit b